MNPQDFRRALLAGGEVRLPGRVDAERRALTVGADGGVVAADALAAVSLYNRLNDYSAALDAGVTVVDTPNGQPYPVVVTVNQPGAQPLAEGTELVETPNVSFSRFYLGAHKYTSQAVLTNEVLADTYVEGWVDELASLGAEGVARVFDPLLIAGSGSGQPSGLIGNVAVQRSGGTNAPSSDNFRDVAFSLNPARYRGSSRDRLRWLMSPQAFRVAAGFPSTGAGTAAETAQALSDDKPLYLFGFPVVLSADVPYATSSGTTVALFGDFSKAYVVRRTGVSVSLSSSALFSQDAQVLRVSLRVDGRVRDASAVRALVIGN